MLAVASFSQLTTRADSIQTHTHIHTRNADTCAAHRATKLLFSSTQTHISTPRSNARGAHGSARTRTCKRDTQQRCRRSTAYQRHTKKNQLEQKDPRKKMKTNGRGRCPTWGGTSTHTRTEREREDETPKSRRGLVRRLGFIYKKRGSAKKERKGKKGTLP